MTRAQENRKFKMGARNYKITIQSADNVRAICAKVWVWWTIWGKNMFPLVRFKQVQISRVAPCKRRHSRPKLLRAFIHFQLVCSASGNIFVRLVLCTFICLFRAANETATRCTARKRGKAGKTTSIQPIRFWSKFSSQTNIKWHEVSCLVEKTSVLCTFNGCSD
jgi:hypothetical protein